MVCNLYDCEENTWQGFTAEGKVRYNNMFQKMINNQIDFIHPLAFPVPAEQWNCLVHNVAWTAAKNAFDQNVAYEKAKEDPNKTIDKLLFIGYESN